MSPLFRLLPPFAVSRSSFFLSTLPRRPPEQSPFPPPSFSFFTPPPGRLTAGRYLRQTEGGGEGREGRKHRHMVAKLGFELNSFRILNANIYKKYIYTICTYLSTFPSGTEEAMMWKYKIRGNVTNLYWNSLYIIILSIVWNNLYIFRQGMYIYI